MAITATIEQSPLIVVLTQTDTLLTVKSLSDASRAATEEFRKAVQENSRLAGIDPRIEWRTSPASGPEDPDWKNWARHYDTIAWTVTSIFTAGSILLGNGYVTARINKADLPILRAIAGCSIGLILFQMFVVGAFRTYRYDLYRAERRRNPNSTSLEMFRQWSGTPWLVYCVVAWIAAMLWVYQLTYLASPWLRWVIGGAVFVTVIIGYIWYWAKPPIFER